jgi:hypothetical protein
MKDDREPIGVPDRACRLAIKEKRIMSNKVTNYRLVVLVIACFAIFSPLAPQIISDLRLTPGQFIGIFIAPMIPAIFLSIAAGVPGG